MKRLAIVLTLVLSSCANYDYDPIREAMVNGGHMKFSGPEFQKCAKTCSKFGNNGCQYAVVKEDGTPVGSVCGERIK